MGRTSRITPLKYLCYCDQCGKLVLPPREVLPDFPSERVHCRSCIPAAAVVSVAAKFTQRDSRPKLKSVTPANGNSFAAQSLASEKRRAPAPQAAQPPWAIIGGVSAAVLLLGIVFFHGGKTEAVVKKDSPPVVKESPVYTDAPESIAVSIPPILEKPKAPEALRTPPPQLNPKVDVPVEANIPPAVAVVAKESAPATAPVNLKPLEEASAQARQLCDKKQFAAALEVLNGLKAAYEKQPEWSTAREQTVQARVAFFKRLEEAQEIANTSKDFSELKSLWSEWSNGQSPIPSPVSITAPVAAANPADGWVVLDAEKIYSEGGATFTRQPDNSYLVSGKNTDKDRYFFETTLPAGGLTAMRLEVMADPSLPKGGPGRFPANGHLAMSKVLTTVAGTEFRWNRVNLLEEAQPYDSSMLTDDNPASHWVPSQQGKDHWAVFYPQKTFGESGQRLVVRLDFESPHDQHNAGRVRISVTSKSPPPAATQQTVGAAPAAASTPTAPPGQDPDVTEAVQKLLTAIESRQNALIDDQNKVLWVSLGLKLDEFEKQARLHQTQQSAEALLKTLDELEKDLLKNAPTLKQFGTRYAQVRADVNAARNGELGFLKGKSRLTNGVVDLAYDFATPEDFNAWTWEDPANTSQASFDAPKQRVVIRTAPGRYWRDPGGRNEAPLLKLPFPFKGSNWSIECDLENVNLSEKPDFGSQAAIGLWDGGARFAWIQAQEDKARNAKIATAVLDGRETYEYSAPASTHFNEPYRVRFACINGALSTVFANKRGGTVLTTAGKLALPFEPLFIVLTIRTPEQNGVSSAAFSKFVLKAMLDPEKLKPLVDAQKKMDAGKILAELEKKLAK